MIDLKDLLEAASHAAVAFQRSSPETPTRIWSEINPWLQRLAMNAMRRWAPIAAQHVECQVPNYAAGAEIGPCSHQALAQCDVCQRVCCLDHCRVDQHGDAVCYVCLMEMVASHRKQKGGRTQWPWTDAPPQNQPPPSAAPDRAAEAAALRAAYKLLGVSSKATLKDLEAAKRKLFAKYHPDRHAAAAAKAEAERKFKEVGAAFDLVMKHRKKG